MTSIDACGVTAPHHHPADLPELVATRRIALRDVADGAGPSHLIAIGNYLLVVDPWAAEIRRYAVADMDAPPHVCRLPRSFAPWRTVRWPGGVRLVAEPYGPEDDGGYDLRPRLTMMIEAGAVTAMATDGDCPFPIHPYDDARDAPGLVDRGALTGGRRLAWWCEIDDRAGDGGRVSASHYVAVIDADGTPGAVVRIQAAVHAPLVAGDDIAVSSLLVKPGFEYVAATSHGGIDMLWVMAADMDAASPRPFVLRGYPLDGLNAGDRAVVRLVAPGETAVDRNDSRSPDDPRGPWTAPVRATFATRADWFADAARSLRAQIAFRWCYPAGATARPCGGDDICVVGANDAGALGAGFVHPVRDKHAPDGRARWMRPRHLIDVAEGTVLRGVPYAIGGFDLAERFAARLEATYGEGQDDPPPIGHIGEGLEWPQQVAQYPLGIDCSALVAEVFGIAVRSTATMVTPRRVVTAGGEAYHLPQGPSEACAEPVRHLRDLLPGDILLRDGHVVIFAGMEPTTGGLRVIEASARCGGVAESVYDPSYFDGWWMLRLALDGIDDGPRWLDGKGVMPPV